MVVDVEIQQWLTHTDAVQLSDAGELAAAGAVLLESEPVLPRTITAECHVRLAALRLLSGSPELATRHAAHAATLAFDMPAEAQLHVIPRAIAILQSCAATSVDTSSLANQAIDRGGVALSSAMETSIGVADRTMIQLSVMHALEGPVSALAPESAESSLQQMRQDAARISLDLETAGELELARSASRIAVPDL